MAIKVNQYNLDRICDRMKKEFGEMKKGDEGSHAMMLHPMEGNMLKIHRTYPESNSRCAAEAVSMALFRIKGYLTGEEYDLTRFQSEENERLVHAMLMAFDPFTNSNIKEVIEQDYFLELTDENHLKEFFQEPIICLLRIKDSIDLWTSENGSNGYFVFTENYMGDKIPRDDKLDYAVQIAAQYFNDTEALRDLIE